MSRPLKVYKASAGSGKTFTLAVEYIKLLIVDPGDEYTKIKQLIEDKEVVGVIITHYHFDHIGALKYFDNNLLFDINNLEEKDYNIDNFNFLCYNSII